MPRNSNSDVMDLIRTNSVRQAKAVGRRPIPPSKKKGAQSKAKELNPAQEDSARISNEQLRDEFAKAALTGLLARAEVTLQTNTFLTRTAFDIAESMMSERRERYSNGTT